MALATAVASVVVAVKDRAARRVLGAILLVLAVVLIVVKAADSGFRFIWGNSEGELIELVIALAFVGFVLVIPRFVVREAVPGSSQPQARMSGGARALTYFCLAALVALLAFGAGTAQAECDAPASDCDLAGLEGILWAFVALGGFVIVVIVTEVRRLVVRRSRETD